MQSWEERQAEMDAWEKKLAAALPEDPSKLSNADHKKVAQVFIDEYGLDAADVFYEDDRGHGPFKIRIGGTSVFVCELIE